MNDVRAREGILFIVSAPSGAGKTSLCRELIDTFPELRQSVSFATRPIRPGERDGVDYHFVDESVFAAMKEQREFAEWATVHGNLYGTTLKTIEDAAQQGVDLLLDIDFQGAAQLKTSCRQGVFIFILPPDMAELERRLRSRGTDGGGVIERRLATAREEISQAIWYDYLVVNDDFTVASNTLKAIIMAERCRSHRTAQILNSIIT